MKHLLLGLNDLIQRYRLAFKASWDIRDTLDPPPRRDDELAFLPAHLELTDTPVSPLPRWSMRIIVGLFGVALLWAIVGQLDIVAVAGGKTITGGRTKIIQPLETAVVKTIHVKDGQHVKAGQLLVELDGVGAGTDVRKAGEARDTARLATLRYQALLDALDSGQLPRLGALDGVTENQRLAEETLAVGQWRAYLAKRDALGATLRQREAELATTRQLVTKLDATAQIAQGREQDYKNLLERNFISRHAYLEKQQDRITQESDLAVQQSRLQEIQAAIANQRQELQALTAEFRREALDQLRSARDQITQYSADASKSSQRQAWMTLTAPVAGTVQQLAVHTVGGVVTEAQPLLAIVPDNETLEVEAQIENKDIGFVKPGQPATVKIESFPYTRYGYLEGKVDTVSHDAMQDEKKGLVYQARIKLNQTHLIIDGTKVNLTSGMAVSAEVKIGKRRVIDYFLSPLREYAGEGMREK
ncbi:HlyD family type I secretion periplasmic adaptor subunit [Vogesella fluminis]|uniref:Membrane fusion protein (MFP) family protein n=1 Tax=Vogesella fluminis TaxID=1069161 RepID=A0ABQ3HEQ5_9NEIS|nr:HlyD family type I secretion periplasmic adaptor subunit [Vogesella fluminis]GHD81701.1 HlyD family type I secretion periplasmic adaptor subunit [Vogesella fluminis]